MKPFYKVTMFFIIHKNYLNELIKIPLVTHVTSVSLLIIYYF